MLEDDSKQPLSESEDDIPSNQIVTSSEPPNPLPVNAVSSEQEAEKTELTEEIQEAKTPQTLEGS